MGILSQSTVFFFRASEVTLRQRGLLHETFPYNNCTTFYFSMDKQTARRFHANTGPHAQTQATPTSVPAHQGSRVPPAPRCLTTALVIPALTVVPVSTPTPLPSVCEYRSVILSHLVSYTVTCLAWADSIWPTATDSLLKKLLLSLLQTPVSFSY
jgi:hypothetical protein